MNITEATQWVRDTADEDADEDTAEAAFAAIFGRTPTDQERAEGLWSHLCAAVI